MTDPQNKRASTDIDKTIGKRIHFARRKMGLTQTELADQVGISFQQIQKYENGRNRVPASRLILMADALGHGIEWFFVDLPEEEAEQEKAA